jgi:hypothetical protein
MPSPQDLGRTRAGDRVDDLGDGVPQLVLGDEPPPDAAPEKAASRRLLSRACCASGQSCISTMIFPECKAKCLSNSSTLDR